MYIIQPRWTELLEGPGDIATGTCSEMAEEELVWQHRRGNSQEKELARWGLGGTQSGDASTPAPCPITLTWGFRGAGLLSTPLPPPTVTSQ